MVRYRESVPSRRAWLVLLAVCVVSWVLLATREDGFWLATILVSMLGGIVALTMWSTDRYGNIRLTDTELRVGRERVALADLHPWGVSAPGEQVSGRIIGGAFGSTLGTRLIGLTKRDGGVVLVASSQPDALRSALEDVLAPYRAQV